MLLVFFFFFHLCPNLITNLYFSRQLPLLPEDAHLKVFGRHGGVKQAFFQPLGDGVTFARSALLIFTFHLLWVNWLEELRDSGDLEQSCVGISGGVRAAVDRVRWGKVSRSQQRGSFTAASSANALKNIKVMCPQTGSCCTHLICYQKTTLHRGHKISYQ